MPGAGPVFGAPALLCRGGWNCQDDEGIHHCAAIHGVQQLTGEVVQVVPIAEGLPKVKQLCNRFSKGGIERYGLRKGCRRFLQFAQATQRAAQIAMGFRVFWAQAQRRAVACDCRIEGSGYLEEIPQVIVRFRIGWGDLQGTPVGLDGRFGSAELREDIAEVVGREGGFWRGDDSPV